MAREFLPGYKEVGARLGFGTQKSQKKGEKKLKQAEKEFEGLETPIFNQYNPELFDFETLGPSAFNDIETNGASRAAREEELAALRAIAERGGRSARGDADLNRITNRGQMLARGSRNAIMENANARGMGGSGAALMANLANQQHAQTLQNQQDLEIAAQNQENELKARGMAGSAARGMEQDDYERARSRAEATDEINRFNALNKQQVGQANVGLRNQAQMANNALLQDQFDNEYRKRAGKAGQYNQGANYQSNQTAINSQAMGNLFGGGAKIGAAYAGAPSAHGSVVPGHSPYPGDDERNDTVPVQVSPGEVIVPRTLAEQGSPDEISEFVQNPPDNISAYMANGGRQTGSVDEFLEINPNPEPPSRDQQMMEFLQKDYETGRAQEQKDRDDALRSYWASNIGQGIEQMLTANAVAHGGNPVDSSFYARLQRPMPKRDNSARDAMLKSYLLGVKEDRADARNNASMANAKEMEQIRASKAPQAGKPISDGELAREQRYWYDRKVNFAKSLRDRAATAGTFGQASKVMFNADRADALVQQGLTQKGGLTGPQMEELATATNRVISNAGQSHRSAVEALVPNTLKGKWADTWQWFFNEPTGRQQQAFVAQMAETIRREKEISQKLINDEKKLIFLGAEDLRKRYPEFVDKLWDAHMKEVATEKVPTVTPDKILPDGTKLKYTGIPGAEYEEID